MKPTIGIRRRIASLLLAASVAVGAAGVGGCSTNPATGQQIFTLMSPEEERQVGAEQHPKILAEFGGVYDDNAIQAYVAGIGARLVANSEQSQLPFTFTVLDSPVVNAFALPGGYVYVTRGLLALADSEAELAGVIGHEIAHVTARHGAQQQGRAVWVGLGAAILGAAIGDRGAADLLNLGGGLILRGYSREQEFEADSLGLRYLVRAGYQPDAMASFLARLRDKSRLDAEILGTGSDPDEYSLMATHPRTIDRVQEARAASIGLAAQGGIVDREPYLRRLDGMLYGDSPEQGYVRGRRFVHPKLRFEFTVPADFVLLNGPTAVRARAPNGAEIRFDAARQEGEHDMLRYITRRWGARLPLTNLTRFDSNGMQGATGVTRVSSNRGPVDIRLVALDGGDGRIYRFLFATPADDTPRQAEALRQTALSFRRISEAEAARERPYRLQVRTARPGDSVAGLARSLPEGPFAEARFRVLNGLAPGEQPQPGSLVKTVVD
ncbi:metalloprotease [Thalassobaculum fulvum]|uniref:Metalloprotease n=1 Tax=Thalassobaculum fulvum TaxID=1633335 RepID=A0A918XXE5_9PROT|nr:M48 family metalloprotease [Thalassobaculum fulvum]GHD63092.1 metalloprotease [Thalassobaculum fulvum]